MAKPTTKTTEKSALEALAKTVETLELRARAAEARVKIAKASRELASLSTGS